MTSQNFSLNLSAQSVTIAPGGSANLMINAAAVGGFNSPIKLGKTLLRELGSNVCFQSFDDHSGVEFGSHLDHLGGRDPAAGYRLRLCLHHARTNGPAVWSGIVWNRSRSPQTENAISQENFVDEGTGFAAVHGAGRILRRGLR